jgi:hypothetical protein
VEEFEATVNRFKEFYMGILTSTFGAEFSASINLNDLEGWIAG